VSLVSGILTLLLVLIDNYIKDKENFKSDFKSQMYYFTKLLKYKDKDNRKINTGDIFKSKEGNDYLLCITPFCDAARPKKVDNILKFIVGINENFEAELLSDKKDNSAITVVPEESTKSMKLIRWKFYHAISKNPDELVEQFEKIATMKKEYIQNILNRYIAYQSRAGVNNIFFKESDYISCFSSMLD
jgi:hypothetical protein